MGPLHDALNLVFISLGMHDLLDDYNLLIIILLAFEELIKEIELNEKKEEKMGIFYLYLKKLFFKKKKKERRRPLRS